MYRLKLKRNSRFTSRKGDLSRHHAMHNFHAVTPILLLFDKSCPEKMANHAITPTAGSASYISSYFNLDSISAPYAYAV